MPVQICSIFFIALTIFSIFSYGFRHNYDTDIPKNFDNLLCDFKKLDIGLDSLVFSDYGSETVSSFRQMCKD